MTTDLASSPGESHPQALLEPCVNLSIHTAPDALPTAVVSDQHCHDPEAPPDFGWPHDMAGQWAPFAPAPLQRFHRYYEALGPCAPHWYSDPHGGPPFGLLPSHRGDRFSRSVQEPDPASRRLCAGRRSGRLQDRSRACPGSSMHLRFRRHLWHFDTSSAVRSRSSLWTSPDGIMSRLLLQRSPRSLLTVAACSGLKPAPDCRLRGARPHLSYSSTPS
jgi:hypothetical protein